MKKVMLVVMVVAIMVAMPVTASAQSQRQFWAGIRNSQKIASGNYYGHNYHGYGYDNCCRYRHGVAAIEDLGKDRNGDTKKMVVFQDGRVLIICANGKITEGSDPRTKRQTLGLAGVLGALRIIVGAH